MRRINQVYPGYTAVSSQRCVAMEDHYFGDISSLLALCGVPFSLEVAPDETKENYELSSTLFGRTIDR
jgi:hypothetical protein